MKNGKVCIFTDLTPGEQVRLTRIALGLRQIDVASQAGVTVIEVIRLEKDGYVLPTRRMQILTVLGLDGESPNG